MAFYFMHIQKSRIIEALSEVDNIRYYHRLHYIGHDGKNKSDADLLSICQTYLSKNILIFCHQQAWDNGPILSFYIKFSDRYEICLLDKLNYCHRKFTLCKELFHIILDNPEFHSINFEKTIDDLMADGFIPDNSVSEMLAEFAAMEFLFPYSDRCVILETNPQPNFAQIAEQYKVPQRLVEVYLSENYISELGSCMPQN